MWVSKLNYYHSSKHNNDQFKEQRASYWVEIDGYDNEFKKTSIVTIGLNKKTLLVPFLLINKLDACKMKELVTRNILNN